MPLAFELNDDVHEVFEQPRSGDRPVLGHVSHEQDADAARLGRRNEGRGDLADLRDPAGLPVNVRARDRLDRVDDDELGGEGLELAEDGAEVGLSSKVEVGCHRLDPLGAGADLRSTLFTADIERGAAISSGPGRDVEQQGRFADSGLTGNENDRSRNESTAEDPIEFADAGRHCGGLGQIDFADARRCGRARAGRGGDRLLAADFLNGAPRLALTAASDPLGRCPAALAAAIAGAGGFGALGHHVGQGMPDQ